MEQKLYDLMDWAGIEELVIFEGIQSPRWLGPHVTTGAFDPGPDTGCSLCQRETDKERQKICHGISR